MSEELGEVRSTHHVDNERRRTIGLWCLAIGTIGALLSVILLSRPEDPGPYRPNQGQASGVVYGITLSALVIGGTYLWKSVRFRNEYFQVREHGLVHAAGRGTRAYPWGEIAHIRIRTGRRTDPVSHYFGSQYWAAITIRNRRRKLKFNGLAQHYETLSAAVLANCPPAPRRTIRRRMTWLGITLVSAAAFGFLVSYIATHQDTEQRIDHGDYVELVHVPGITDTGIYVIVAGLLVTFVIAVTAFAFFWRKD